MDESRLKKTCQKILDMSYSGVTISEFRALPTQKFDEDSGEWIPDSFSLFVILKRPPVNYKDQSYRDVENFLESLLGFETCVDFV
jgi:hypothetical protein